MRHISIIIIESLVKKYEKGELSDTQFLLLIMTAISQHGTPTKIIEG